MPQVNNDAYGQTAPPPELRVTEDSCDQRDRSSQACTERGAIAANREDRAEQRHQEAASRSSGRGKAIRGSTRKPEINNTRVTFRRPLPVRSILYYRRRRHALALWDFRVQEQREAFLARRQHLDRLASKFGYGYKLKLGNYQIAPRGMRTIFII
ncbi:hypothetical protein LA080_007412 [Diaporthe eres]|nr:hypothetical protein LA080_007412 [Diaporthe eres]